MQGVYLKNRLSREPNLYSADMSSKKKIVSRTNLVRQNNELNGSQLRESQTSLSQMKQADRGAQEA